MGMTNKIRALSALRGITQKDLAESLGVSQPVLSQKYALDNWREEDLRDIAKLLDADVEIKFVLHDTGEKF